MLLRYLPKKSRLHSPAGPHVDFRGLRFSTHTKVSTNCNFNITLRTNQNPCYSIENYVGFVTFTVIGQLMVYMTKKQQWTHESSNRWKSILTENMLNFISKHSQAPTCSLKEISDMFWIFMYKLLQKTSYVLPVSYSCYR